MKRWCLWLCLAVSWAGMALVQEECQEVEPRGIADELTDGFPENLATPEQREDVISRIRTELSGYYYDIELLKNQKGMLDELEQDALAATSEHDFYNVIRAWTSTWDEGLTTFTSSREVAAQQAFGNQPFAGIGVTVDYFGEPGDGMIIGGLRPDGPAKAAGLRPGDRVLQINGDACFVIENFRGEENSQVTLLVQSPGQEPRELTLTRRRFASFTPSESVSYRLISQPSIGYFFVGDLGNEAFYETKHKTLQRLIANNVATQPQELRGFILDLRINSTGDISGINDFLGYFVSSSPYMFVNGLGNQNFQYVLKKDTILQELPLAVLVDDNTSKIAVWVAAILQQRPKTVVIGKTTKTHENAFGYTELPDGSEMLVPNSSFALKNPDGKLSSPGIPLTNERVTPDVIVEEGWLNFKRENDPYIKVALEELAKLKE